MTTDHHQRWWSYINAFIKTARISQKKIERAMMKQQFEDTL